MQRKAKNQKYLHLPIAFFLRFCYNDQVLAMWGISTVGRTSLQLFIPAGGSRRKAVSVRSAQNSTRKFGALAQLVARDIRIVEVRSSNLLCSTTVRPKIQLSDGHFVLLIQNLHIRGPKSRKREGSLPQISAIFLIFGIAMLR